MNLSKLQAELRHFAAERDWQPFHTPKNLSTALMVEAAELAEVFQWMTPEASRLAHQDATTKQSIADEVADVLLYLLQVADHSEIDLEKAVRDKLTRNGVKHPAKRHIARVSPARASVPGTHVLLDYENVQPSGVQLRSLVPDAGQLWIFHGPHQREVEQRFASFGAEVTAVPISQIGKNALDFHLSFYMGYIASRNPAATMVVVANDKGYEPMLQHARDMGFVVRRQSHGQAKASAKPVSAKKAPAKKGATGKTPDKQAPAKKAAAKKAAAKQLPAKKAAVKKISPTPVAKKVPAVKTSPAKKAVPAKEAVAKPRILAPAEIQPVPDPGAVIRPVPPAATVRAARPSAAPANEIRKITDSLRKMGPSRPTKPASLRRLLKSLLAPESGEGLIEVALARLIASGVVVLGANGAVAYPAFEAQAGAGSASP